MSSPTNQHSVLLEAGCPCCCPTNSTICQFVCVFIFASVYTGCHKKLWTFCDHVYCNNILPWVVLALHSVPWVVARSVCLWTGHYVGLASKLGWSRPALAEGPYIYSLMMMMIMMVMMVVVVVVKMNILSRKVAQRLYMDIYTMPQKVCKKFFLSITWKVLIKFPLILARCISDKCLTTWHKNYPLHLMYVCTLPCKVMTAKIVTKSLGGHGQLSHPSLRGW